MSNTNTKEPTCVVTLAEVLALEPCYTESQLTRLYPAGSATVQEIAADERVPSRDRVWILAKLGPSRGWVDRLTDRDAYAYAYTYAHARAHAHAPAAYAHAYAAAYAHAHAHAHAHADAYATAHASAYAECARALADQLDADQAADTSQPTKEGTP